jgi:hypothetical protein
MKKILLLSGIVMIFSYPAFSQPQKARVDSSLLPQIAPHYQEEYEFDASTNAQAWLSHPSGLHISFGSTEQLYFRREVPVTTKLVQQQFVAWKGERVNMQVLVWSPDTINQVRFRINNLGTKKVTASIKRT